MLCCMLGERTRPSSCLASPRRVDDAHVNGSLNVKETGEKLARPVELGGGKGGRVISGTRDHVSGA